MGFRQREQKSIHWASKDLLQKEKRLGGLGFKRLEMFNEALFMKQAWRIISKPELLLSKTLKAKYFPEVSLFNITARRNTSHAWKGIANSIEALRMGCSSLIESDNIRWNHSSSEDLTVRSTYTFLVEYTSSSSNGLGGQSDTSVVENYWLKFWRIGVACRVKHLIWSIFHDYLPTRWNLLRRSCIKSSVCALFDFLLEDNLHIFHNYWIARAVWGRLGLSGIVLARVCED